MVSWYDMTLENEPVTKNPRKKKKNIRGWYIFIFKRKRAVRIIENWYINTQLL